jgi:hypothetical protein
VFLGYIDALADIRRLPLEIGTADSFSQATVRAYNKDLLKHAEAHGLTNFPYAEFIPLDRFKTLSATSVLSVGDSAELEEELGHKIAIVGGDWHSKAYKTGPLIDSHLTPVGQIPGVLVHANYVEAILRGDASSPLSAIVLKLIEVFLVGIVAVLIAAAGRPWLKAAAAIAAPFAFLLLNYVLLQNLGLYTDFLIPLVLVAGHPVVEWTVVAAKSNHNDGTRSSWWLRLHWVALVAAIVLLATTLWRESTEAEVCVLGDILGVAKVKPPHLRKDEIFGVPIDSQIADESSGYEEVPKVAGEARLEVIDVGVDPIRRWHEYSVDGEQEKALVESVPRAIGGAVPAFGVEDGDELHAVPKRRTAASWLMTAGLLLDVLGAICFGFGIRSKARKRVLEEGDSGLPDETVEENLDLSAVNGGIADVRFMRAGVILLSVGLALLIIAAWIL